MSVKTCVITGASRGIGLATALRFARQGCNVAAVARNGADLTAAAKQVRALGGACEAIVRDVADPAGAHEAIALAAEHFGQVDILVNNAGAAPLAPIEQFTRADFERVVAVNMAAVFYTTQAVWPIMRRQNGGVIVNVSSVASVDPYPGFAVYGASKAWVNLFSQALAGEGKPFGIRVFAVAPGAVDTKLLRSNFPDYPADQALAPDDVAAVIESACDPRLAPASGQTLFVRK